MKIYTEILGSQAAGIFSAPTSREPEFVDAGKRSVDELMSLCEWEFRSRPFQLGLVREIYNRCSFDLMLALEAARR